MLVECKPVGSELSLKHASQLYRYFAATNARISLLTNGVVYQFYTDSDRANMMDDKPFFTFNLESYRKSDLAHLATFQRADFDLDRIVRQAGTLKLQSQVSTLLRAEFAEPSDDLVKLVAGRLHDGKVTEQIRDRYRSAIASAISGLIRDGVNQRLETAMRGGDIDETPGDDEPEGAVVTTQVEIDGFNIVRAIASSKVDPTRVIMRDAKSYCAVLLDDNNRRTIARLHFNSPTARHLGLFEGKAENKVSVEGPVDIYKHSKAILARIAELEAGK